MRRSGSHATLAVVVSAGAAVVSVVELALTSGKSPMLVVTAGRSPSAAEPLSRRAGAQRKVKEQRPEQQSVSTKQDSSSFPHGVCGPLAVVEVRVVVVTSVVALALTSGKSPMLVVTAGNSPSAAEPRRRSTGAQRRVNEQRPEQHSQSM
mmetsp:Transcript_63340/g.177136  ORF Transcript_63340/g.177136 Transcript_63340/m.177136 type:complete len:150 (+) Transcript_63340:669-1118(+)